MANVLHSDVLDFGLSVLDSAVDAIIIVSADPASYVEATTTLKLGSKTFTRGSAFGAPAAGTPNGRAVVSVAITDGVVNASGTATGWCAIDSTTSRLLANGDLAASQPVVSGNTFSLGPFTVRIPNQ